MYARSLFQAARDAGKLDIVHEQLGDFAAAVGAVPELRRVLENPELDPQQKAGILGEIMGDADELLRNFVLLVTQGVWHASVVDVIVYDCRHAGGFQGCAL